MNITIGVYTFHNNEVIIQDSFKVTKETEKCYFSDRYRFLKSEIGVPTLKSATAYPYIELAMVDADKVALKRGLSSWFARKALDVWE